MREAGSESAAFRPDVTETQRVPCSQGILEPMGVQRRASIRWLAVGAVALWAGACGGGSDAPPGIHLGGAGGHGGAGAGLGAAGAGLDGGVAGYDGGAADAARCPMAGDLTPEPAAPQVALDGGVPVGEIASAFAVAHCSYLSRCFALSTYAANECVDQVVSNKSYFFPPSGVTIGYPDPSDALLQAAVTGAVRYDAQQASTCIAALLTAGCAAFDLFPWIPACTGVFTCLPEADGGSGATDAGAADAGATCPQLIGPFKSPLATCSTDADCADVTPGFQGPDCVAGLCAPSRCGITGVAGCTSFVAAGEGCLSNTLSALNASVAANAMCAPGLNCQGGSSDGGYGVCVVPVDVGGACTDDTNCKPALACACGICEVPPASGPCVNKLCEVGVAYCDRVTNICHPVRASGASCADANNSCAPGLVCEPDFSVCQPPS